MAPALTEAGQSQNFKLPPSAHSSPASPLGVKSNGLQNISATQFLSEGDILCKSGPIVAKYSARENLAKGRLNGIRKNNIKEIPLARNSIAVNNFATFAASKPLKGREELNSGGETSEASESGCSQEGSFMMNNCDPSMGDQEDNMGLQKSNSTVPTLETGSFLKEKGLSNDMDQLFKNLGAAISASDLGSSGDLGQNVEELLQVINNMESSTTESDVHMPGDAVGLGSLDPSENVETETMFPISDGADLTGGLSTFERELLNDVDMMNMCVDVNLGENTLVIENKETLTKARLEEVRKKQHEIERKCEWLLRRLRKLQARTIGEHAGEEVAGVLEHVHRLLKQSASQKEPVMNSDFNQSVVDVGEEVCNNKLEHRKEKRVKGISSGAMAGLLRRLDMLSQQQAAIYSRHQVANKYFGSGSSDHSFLSTSNNGPRALPKFNAETKHELEKIAGRLHTHLSIVEHAMDSDATASSSGGESCDEMQSYNNQHQIQLSISKRAAWRWAQDRAGVASRWTWLQAQISDLEYRIRQHNDIHRQIRAAKGPVCLGEHPAVTTANSTSTTTTTASRTTVPSSSSSLHAGGRNHPNNHHPHSVVVNGFHGALPGGGKTEAGDACAVSCTRTRPLLRAMFRKRKLLQMAGLHLSSKKAARSSNVRCGCQVPHVTCAVCTGRADPTLPQPDLLTASERIALLDPCFHPVLSFPEDVPQRIHYEAIMKTSEWQQKTLRSSLKAMKTSGAPKMEKDTGLERRNKKQQVEHRKKYTSRLKKTATNTLTAKIKRKLTKGRKPKVHDPNNHSLQRLKRKRAQSKSGLAMFLGPGSEEVEDDMGMESSLMRTSPIPSPLLLGNLSSASERLASSLMGKERGDGARRKRENSYDIDNIVIPYSIAASTRLEKLQYKEIPTPKWRISEYTFDSPVKLDLKNNGVVRRSSQDSDVEDLSEEMINLRHDRCEVEEKKKFMSYLKFPHTGRSRARRADSRAESSGANTPDPMSPNNMLDHLGEVGGSPLTSPPATPLPVTLDNDNPCQQLVARRRTVSQSRWAKEREEVRCITPEYVAEVAPFETRTFPLPDEVYEKMLKSMPEGHPFTPLVIEPKKSTKDNELGEVSRPVSPSTDSTESALGEGEDPNDPEWTVEEEKEFEREKLKTSVKR